MAENISIEKSVLLGMKNKDIFFELKRWQQQVKEKNTELLDIQKQPLKAKDPKYP